ncbi:bzip transcription factor [Pyrenophora tritici-repentis]|uniref:Bzip transcription factor n=2 Tax=Pyrenophora tritici-repentis TaxID=45151 RepID=A0A2W1EVN7_9PLEO|nr:uncharacterized protein PTRG_01994 [Pyrenophora tritici-repentis Pt-1C-BFP]KAA8626700.1 bzip transcription factor [Pyrenophora tritici-repentis]EDU41432.1 conserved hypothetical protein [Pyrenophora tritici-repentis Pt-1C-BFP]KAF7455132.1 bzip transcription factor [Pyrenophora tritici-repentis]KAF7578297.1 bZIP transcription factor (Atf21) [Pyrenophora tritici-repentis]KAG9388887.1 bzip transcription factor [Pyrenophora tritici-repentis]
MTDIQHHPLFDWAGEAFTAMQHPSINQLQDKWAAALSNPSSGSNSQAFAIPPSLLTNGSMERFGQVTPPEELSPQHPVRNDREASIPVDQLRNETSPWSKQTASPRQVAAAPEEPSPKRQRTSRTSTNQSSLSSVALSLQEDNADTNPQPPKRKRGRPKSQPQMVQAYTADGYPFQVSSARQTHLEKNRVAAHKCRQRKKEYINSLEDRAREFSSKNKMLKENVAVLREEVLSLKNEVLLHAGCGFWAVDEYLARCAGNLLGMEAPPPGMRNASSSRNNSINHNTQFNNTQQTREPSMGSLSSADGDDFGGLELLKDFTDEDMDDLEA